MSPYIYKRDSEDNSSLAEPVSSGQSQLKEKLLCVPANIAQSQKLLRTSIFQTPEPQFPTKCLILNIYKIKHQQLEVSTTCNIDTSDIGPKYLQFTFSILQFQYYNNALFHVS